MLDFLEGLVGRVLKSVEWGMGGWVLLASQGCSAFLSCASLIYMCIHVCVVPVYVYFEYSIIAIYFNKKTPKT